MSDNLPVEDMADQLGWAAISRFVLTYGYCSGCGVCAGICPCNALEMRFNKNGEYNPYLVGKCTDCGLCSSVCPFINGNPNEDELSKRIFGDQPNIHQTPETGYYIGNHVGYVANEHHRWKGASGGMATWFLEALLKNDIVDHVICVVSNPDPQQLFKFTIISQAGEIIHSAKSVYYPVELSHVLKIVMKKPGRYAVIGLPCAIKAVRLASLQIAKLKKRIIVYVGLTCGQTKSKGFTEIIARKMNINIKKIDSVIFRDKQEGRARFNFSIIENKKKRTATMDALSFALKAWTSGLFKLKACNFCDDIFAELSDIAFMDARLPEYSNIYSGTSIVITRSSLANDILNIHGIQSGKSVLEKMPIDTVIRSQVELVEIKRDLLRYRLWVESKKNNKQVPLKRVDVVSPSFLFRFMVYIDEVVRKNSFIALEKQRNSRSNGLSVFIANIRAPMLVRRIIKKIVYLKDFH